MPGENDALQRTLHCEAAGCASRAAEEPLRQQQDACSAGQELAEPFSGVLEEPLSGIFFEELERGARGERDSCSSATRSLACVLQRRVGPKLDHHEQHIRAREAERKLAEPRGGTRVAQRRNEVSERSGGGGDEDKKYIRATTKLTLSSLSLSQFASHLLRSAQLRKFELAGVRGWGGGGGRGGEEFGDAVLEDIADRKPPGGKTSHLWEEGTLQPTGG